MEAPLPYLSYIYPNNGVKRIVPKGKIEGISPAVEGSTPNLFTINPEENL